MPPELSAEAWAQIRQDYEHTERPVADICAGHGISTGTLRDRMRRWNWTRRRLPVPEDGPPPAPPMPAVPAPPRAERTSDAIVLDADIPPYGTGPERFMPGPDGGGPPYGFATPDDRAIVPRLRSAVARVLPAIEANLATLAAGPAHPREMERAARALTALTRTLSQLNGQLRQHQDAVVAPACDCQSLDMDELRRSLARKIEALIEERHRETLGCAALDEV